MQCNPTEYIISLFSFSGMNTERKEKEGKRKRKDEMTE
jgi:hypothetical protein